MCCDHFKVFRKPVHELVVQTERRVRSKECVAGSMIHNKLQQAVNCIWIVSKVVLQGKQSVSFTVMASIAELAWMSCTVGATGSIHESHSEGSYWASAQCKKPPEA